MARYVLWARGDHCLQFNAKIMNSRNILAGIFVLSSLGALPAGAAVLAAWTFEPQPFSDAEGLNSTVGPTVMASSGVFASTSTATGLHANAATDWTTPAGNISTDSYGVNTFAVGDYFQFATESTGYTGITITFDQTGSGTGPKDFKVQYSADGISYTDLLGGAYVVLLNGAPNPSWGALTGGTIYSYSFDLAAVTALDNDTSIFFRLTNSSTSSINGGTVAAGGTSRVDNFVVSGIPEPSAMLLGSFGVLGILRRRR
jgi:PEP-CTERM motif